VRGALATPQLLTDIDIPESISLLGQTVDLSSLRDALAPARRSLQSAVSQVRQTPAELRRPATLRLLDSVGNADTGSGSAAAQVPLTVSPAGGNDSRCGCAAGGVVPVAAAGPVVRHPGEGAPGVVAADHLPGRGQPASWSRDL
jgi:hypothetical protein